MNEERGKVKIVLPVLERFGIPSDEISLEKSFSVRPGRYTYRVDTEKQVNTMQSRLDLLIPRGEKNLFGVEVKAKAHSLTEKNRRQAISYAGLVRPIAPYAITTNGVDTHIYETVSGKEVSAQDLNLVTGYEVTLPDKLRNQIQKVLLGYSSSSQSEFRIERTAILRGLVYEQIQREFDEALDLRLGKYGVPRRR